VCVLYIDCGTTTNFDIIQINDVWNKLGAQIENSTTRGFTGHEHFDQVGIIHMNGRIYDPSIGRFLQADPLIQDPYNTQSLNRYSYVMNNPLSYTDPSGYARLRKGWWRTPLAIGISVWLPGSTAVFGWFANTAVSSIITGAISGAIATGNLKGAVKGGLFAALTYGIGHKFKGFDGKKGIGFEGSPARILAHSIAAGVSAEVDGGKFGNGFVSALLSQNIGKGNIFNPDKVGGLAIVTNAILQGSISEATGGKFANGAMSAAFRVAFNEALVKNKPRQSIAVGFDGAGSETLPDNVAIADLATDLDAKLFNSRGGPVFSPVGKAYKYILNELESSPNANIFIFGYSAGGNDAIRLTNKLADAGISVAGLVTFDPHSGKRATGFANYSLPSNVISAINFTQQNKTSFFDGRGNPFNGGIVTCGTCSSNSNINYTGSQAVHANIVQYSIRDYRQQIYDTLGN